MMVTRSTCVEIEETHCIAVETELKRLMKLQNNLIWSYFKSLKVYSKENTSKTFHMMQCRQANAVVL